MSALFRRIAPLVLTVFFFGWVSYYTGWWNPWYSNMPENYAFPASLSNDHDPHWGFWYW
ncbi:MAG: hypothetical protein HY914_15445 [Desulfomonile tiedjei]|nr:hypothetical protein [Desulfomonile tiedjei]